MAFFIEGLLDMSADISIIISEPWHLNWPLQEVDVQFLGIRTLYQVKQIARWVEHIGLEGQTGRWRLYIANIAMKLWGCALLQQ